MVLNASRPDLVSPIRSPGHNKWYFDSCDSGWISISIYRLGVVTVWVSEGLASGFSLQNVHLLLVDEVAQGRGVFRPCLSLCLVGFQTNARGVQRP